MEVAAALCWMKAASDLEGQQSYSQPSTCFIHSEVIKGLLLIQYALLLLLLIVAANV